MAHRRGAQQSVSSPVTRKRYSFRRSPRDSSRGVLLPLNHLNLRSLPQRQLDADGDSMWHTGAKRKRVASSNENAHALPTHRRRKRRKGSDSDSDSDGAPDDDMDIEPRSAISDSISDNDTDEDEDDQLLQVAQSHELHRLRKDDLCRLYRLANLSGDAEAMTKSELVDEIIGARDDIGELPPSSPRGEGSDYSSEAPDFSDSDEEKDQLGHGRRPNMANLRRRATTNDINRPRGRPAKNRSFSWGIILPQELPTQERRRKNSGPEAAGRSHSRRRSNSRSSPPVHSLTSPPATRLRSRKFSEPSTFTFPVTPTRPVKGKGKAKQVEFTASTFLRPQRDREANAAEESDLTDLDDLVITEPSPRRLRSKDRQEPATNGLARSASSTFCQLEDSRPKTTGRKRKPSVAEDSDAEISADEVDELASSTAATPQPSRKRPQEEERTPVKKRLRPRKLFVEDDASDEEIVDDEEENEDDEDEEVESEERVPTEPRKLRSGKIVGEEEDEDIAMQTADEESVASEDTVSEEDSTGQNDDDSESNSATLSDADAEGELEDEVMSDEDMDLTDHTTKTLTRLRRDDLVRLCESRDLDAVGTKPQLAEALLQWRDSREQTDYSDPSSIGTVRPPSTVVKKRNGNRRHSTPTQESPLLLRPDHGQLDCGPRTPTPFSGKKDAAAEPELELDLESLGLDDREIPPEKLTKLEKIGSGGFKDVFIGKFRGRKIAISEFRGQLNAMDIKELKLLGGFDHPNIVRFLGVSIPENTKETPVMIVSELCSNGDLFDYVRNVSAPSLHKVLNMMLDIARGLEYLHMRKPSVIHRDCKSSNILITSKGTAKIADFGLAKVKQSTRSMVRSLVGTVNWQAPELWTAHPKYNHKVDVFSCAMVYWEMLQWHVKEKKFPWEGMNEHAIYDLVGTKRQRPPISGLKKLWCPEIVDLVEHMWAQEHQDRPTISQVVERLAELVKMY